MSPSRILQLKKEVDRQELNEVVEYSLDSSTSSANPQSSVKLSSPSPLQRSRVSADRAWHVATTAQLLS